MLDGIYHQRILSGYIAGHILLPDRGKIHPVIQLESGRPDEVFQHMEAPGNRNIMLYPILHVIPPFLLFKDQAIDCVVLVHRIHAVSGADVLIPAYLADMLFSAQGVKLIDGKGKLRQRDIDALVQRILAVAEVDIQVVIIVPVGGIVDARLKCIAQVCLGIGYWVIFVEVRADYIDIGGKGAVRSCFWVLCMYPLYAEVS